MTLRFTAKVAKRVLVVAVEQKIRPVIAHHLVALHRSDRETVVRDHRLHYLQDLALVVRDIKLFDADEQFLE